MWQKRLAERSGYGLVAIADEAAGRRFGLWLEPIHVVAMWLASAWGPA